LRESATDRFVPFRNSQLGATFFRMEILVDAPE